MMSSKQKQIEQLPKELIEKEKENLGILYFPELVTEDDVEREIKLITKNPFYFIGKYVWVPTAGVPTKFKLEDLLPKQIGLIKSLIRFDKHNNLASRRSRKTTIANIMVLWSTMFFPNLDAAVITYKEKTVKKDILGNICKMYYYLPDILKELFVMSSPCQKTKTYLEFENGSRIIGYSAKRDPETVARGGNVPIVYIDEAAFINYDIISASLLPAHEDAVRQVKPYGLPYFFLLTSTPNGREGIGKGYYENWIHSIPLDLLYDYENNRWKSSNPEKLYYELLMDESKNYNGFIGVKIHWSEFPYRDENWAEERKRELGYYSSPEGRRKWYQEYELMFLGSEYSLFPDEVLEKFSAIPPKRIEILPYSTKLKLWVDKLDPEDLYIIGIDTALSIKGDYSAFEMYSVKTGEQIAEFKNRFGFVESFIETILYAIKILQQKYNLRDNFYLAIENNSYGQQVVEKMLIYHEQRVISTTKKNGMKEYGIKTTSTTKKEMVNIFYEKLVNNPYIVHSDELISELFAIEVKGHKIEAAKGHHDDLFMASCLAHYGLELLRRQRKLPLKYLKYVDKSAYEELKRIDDTIKRTVETFSSLINNNNKEKELIEDFFRNSLLDL